MMTRPEFKFFVEKTLAELKLTAETYAGEKLPDFCSFQWLRENDPIHVGFINIVEAIINETYVDTDKIYPCVDLRVHFDIKKHELSIKGFRANYEPRPFQRGWSNRPGPFIYAISQELYGKNVDYDSEEFRERMYAMGLWHKSPEE
jgi:hypothetical protein